MKQVVANNTTVTPFGVLLDISTPYIHPKAVVTVQVHGSILARLHTTTSLSHHIQYAHMKCVSKAVPTLYTISDCTRKGMYTYIYNYYIRVHIMNLYNLIILCMSIHSGLTIILVMDIMY